MAKKTKKDSYQGDPGDEHVEKVVVETPVVEAPKTKKKKSVEDGWQIKDRLYHLKMQKKPLTYIKKNSKHFSQKMITINIFKKNIDY